MRLKPIPILLLLLGTLPQALPAAEATGDEPPPLMHIDPLDEGRASAMHRGPNPHAQLSPRQHLDVAAQHMAAGRLLQAMAVLTQAIARYPDESELFNMRAALALKQQDIRSALADMEQAVRLAPENPLYRVTRARLYLQFERQDEALKDLGVAIKLKSDLVPALFNRGALLANLGREQEALADFDRCIEVEPDLPAPWFNRGSMHWATGDRRQARADIERFIELSGEDSWKKAGRDLLQAWNEVEARETAGKAPEGAGQ